MRDDTRVKTIWLEVKEPVKDENEAELFLEDNEGHLWSIRVKANFHGAKRVRRGELGSEDEVRKDMVKIMADVCPLCDEKFGDALDLRNHIIICKGRKRGEE